MDGTIFRKGVIMMGKILDTPEYRRYQKQLAELMQEVNPKPPAKEIKRLKEQYLKAREKQQKSE